MTDSQGASSYRFVDTDVEEERTYRYVLSVRYATGAVRSAEPLLATVQATIEATALLPNYPNPFNPETWIPYELASESAVTIDIYDQRGSLIRRLDLGYQPRGRYVRKEKAAYWDGRNALGERVSSGVYYYMLRAGDYAVTRKLLVIK